MPFLIDGHNLIGAMPDLHLEDPDDEARLAERLQRLAMRTGRRITVIFDRRAPGGPSSFSRGVVTVRFAPSGTTADELLIQQIQAERNPRGLIVVSSDRRVQEAARRRGAAVWSAAEFLAYMQRALGGRKPPEGIEEEKPEGVNESELKDWLELFQGRDSGA
ncbi:NYN domain-containing protein [Thermoflexus sp.]|uniref:NYN domain-containing protein n=1 Tax=Thermoflexus sp. TaxID=1969742 RepID=UPI0035E4298C